MIKLWEECLVFQQPARVTNPSLRESQRINLITQAMKPLEGVPYGSDITRIIFVPQKPLKGVVRTSQVDESRAQLFIAEGKYREAEKIARNAAHSFERAGRQCLLAEALTTQGIALARLRETEHAQYIFQKAIEIAHDAGSLNSAGMAALTMIEEIDTLSPEVQSVAYTQAREWLADRQSPDTKPRLKAVRKKIGGDLLRKPKVVDVSEVLFNKNCDLDDELLKYERDLIRRTLAKVNGQVSDAAKMLNVGRQRLAHRIEKKHPDLLNERTPVRRRPRKRY